MHSNKEAIWEEVNERANWFIWAGDVFTEQEKTTLWGYAREVFESAYDAGFKAGRVSDDYNI